MVATEGVATAAWVVVTAVAISAARAAKEEKEEDR